MHEPTQAPPVSLPVINPRTGEIDTHIVAATRPDIEALGKAMRESQPSWDRLGLDRRLTLMRDWADAIERHAQAIGMAESADTGRLKMSLDQPRQIAEAIRGWCDKAPEVVASALREGVSTVNPHVSFRTQLVPFQLIGIISPWNNPCFLSTLDAVPALIAGAAVIVKPSEITPRFVEPMMRALAEVPQLATVLTYIVGGRDSGQALVDTVDLVCFTGSIPTGRKIAEACARRFIPCFLELGGKDAAIVTASADIEAAATAVLKGGILNNGQLCFGTERVYVERPAFDAFVARLAAKAAAIAPNYPDIGRGHLAPFTLPRQADIIDAHMQDAIDKGARIVVGGMTHTLGGGRYMPATVLVDVTHDMRIMREESFGPVIPVMPYDSVEQALSLANDSHYGLSGAVIAGSVEEAEAIAMGLNAGAISLQDTALTTNIMQDAEKCAFNLSGMGGSRMGPNAILRFYRKKALIAQRGAVVGMDAFAEAAQTP